MSVCLLVACAASHPRTSSDGGAPDAARGRIDAGRDAAAAPLDVGRDAPAIPDAACARREERSTRLCVLAPTGSILAGEPSLLPISRSSCLCEPRLCEVRVSERRVDLQVTTCEADIDCDECTTEVECALPPLREGLYEVWVDGTLAGDLRAEPRRMVTEARPACWAIPDAAPVELACEGAILDRALDGTLCHRDLEDVGSFVTFELTLDCAGCRDWSAGCEARRESSRSVLLRPRVEECACPGCGPCEDACVPLTVRCQTPPLRDGDYEVLVERLDGTRTTVSRFTVEDVAVPGPVRCRAL